MKIDKDELEFANAFIQEEIDRIYQWNIGDIRVCCRLNKNGKFEKGGALVGAYLLWCCSIDYFGGLATNHAKAYCRMEYFINTYLKPYGDYKVERIYKLRNSLIHSYTPEGFALQHLSKFEKYHLTKTSRGCLLHLKKCVEDIEGAAKNYIDDLKKDDKLKIIAWRYYKKYPPIKPYDDSKEVKYYGKPCT